MARSVVETDAEKLTELAKQIDKLVYDESLSIFLCCPMALVAVNRHVKFTGHAATLELAETELTEEHWSRRQASGYRHQGVDPERLGEDATHNKTRHLQRCGPPQPM